MWQNADYPCVGGRAGVEVEVSSVVVLVLAVSLV